jgi:hypothetical protein
VGGLVSAYVIGITLDPWLPQEGWLNEEILPNTLPKEKRMSAVIDWPASARKTMHCDVAVTYVDSYFATLVNI